MLGKVLLPLDYKMCAYFEIATVVTITAARIVIIPLKHIIHVEKKKLALN